MTEPEPTKQERMAESRKIMSIVLDGALGLYNRREILDTDSWRDESPTELWEDVVANVNKIPTQDPKAHQATIKACRAAIIAIAKLAAKLITQPGIETHLPLTLIATGITPEQLQRLQEGKDNTDITDRSICEFYDKRTHCCTEDGTAFCLDPKVPFCLTRLEAKTKKYKLTKEAHQT